jgi:pyruvate formate lyase activating enzyme
VPWAALEQALPLTDLFLLDIKHTDAAKHRQYTGQSNELILENARRLAPRAKALIVRVPVVLGFNDTPAEIADIARFAASLRGVSGVHLLPYHRLGQDKYAGLGRTYAMGDALPPSQEHMARLLEAAQPCGLPVQIGGS